MAAPLVRRRFTRHAAEARLAERFKPLLSPGLAQPVWIHACSLGEVNTALPLFRAAREYFGEEAVLLTASTLTGRDRAQQVAGRQSAFFPMDHPRSVRRFLDELKPRMLVLLETELWPNVLRECTRRDIPVLVVNARLSDKHFARYKRIQALAAPMFRQITAVGAQTQEYADRFIALGVPPAHVEVTGNLKFDAAPTEVPQMQRAKLRAACGIPENAPVLVFGSTRPGDEALASACWATLREEYPGLHLVVAPRHIERRDEVRAHFGEPVLLRSEVKEGTRQAAGERVLLVDTVGELTQFYAAGSLAVIGGSFYPGVEGHNPIEAAALGALPVFGPHMRNFSEPAALLLAEGAAIQVPCAEDLYETLSALIRDTLALRQMGTLARRVVLDHQGATQRNLRLLQHTLKGGLPRP
jgi:3-deoxy-D-manno-octulosonic-acid transferase